MGLALPQVVTEDRASGAQIVDGSLKFDASKSQYLTRTPGSAGNRRTWTWSGWLKRASSSASNKHPFYGAYGGSSATSTMLAYDNSTDDVIRFEDDFVNGDLAGKTPTFFRDFGVGWYHVVISLDTTKTTVTDGLKIYVNGTQQTGLTSTIWNQNHDSNINSTVAQYLGSDTTAANRFFDGAMSQVYFIDGLVLGPSYFGFTDPLTNTWRPKKFKAEGTTINDGTVWSNSLTTNAGDNFDASGPKVDAFDGDSTDKCYTANNSDGTTQNTSYIQFNSPVVLNGDVEIYVDNGNAVFSVDSSGGLILLGKNSSGSDNQRVGLGYIQTSKLRVLMEGGSRPAIGAISVDGVIMIDSTTTNLAFGTNGFYLPMDGNSPIGEDKSGNGNNWTPVNFGSSVALDKATGALPILNTGGGGNFARPGVFGSEVGFRDTVSSSSGGGNPYIFDTNGTQPTFNFIRGATYVFDYSSATSHPLRFATAADAAGSTEYTDGTSVSGNVISFTVPHNAPNTLYYYCTNHGGMGNSISITTDETKADPYAWKNVLAVPLVGNANDVSNSVNSGTTTKSVTVSGATASTAESNIYGGSFVFDGSNDEITVGGVSTDLDFGTGDYTAEAWFRLTTTGDEYIISMGTDHGGAAAHWGINIYSTNLIRAGRTNSGGDASHSVTHPFITNKWYHVAISRSGGISRLFLDGNLLDEESNTDDIDPTTDLKIGRYGPGAIYYNGYIQDVRIYKGVGKYTGSFNPPSTNPDILPDTPSGVSGGSKLAKITDGAVVFDGSGDYLSLASSSDLTFGTGDFTVEMLVYANNFTNRGTFYDSRPSGGTTGITIGHESSTGEIRVYMNATSGSDIIAQSTDFATGRWYHVAVTCESTSVRLFVNGVLKDTGTGRDLSNTNAVNIGYKSYTSSGYNYFNGFISNFRVLKGTALYTANFTPPTRALTNVTNTKLLCCQSNTLAGTAAVSPNISGVNDGTVWSSSLTSSSGFRSSEPAANAFDGDTSSICSAVNDGTITFTSPVTFASDSTIRVVVHGGDHTVTVNGGANQTISAGSLQTVTYSNSGNATFVMTFKRATSADTGVRAIEIGGTVLTDPVSPKGDAAATNFNPFNTDINTVRGQETGYCTLNPLDILSQTLSDGNLQCTGNTSTSGATGTISVSSGKYYYEFYPGSSIDIAGIWTLSRITGFPGSTSDSYGYFGDGQSLNSGAGATYATAFGLGDVIGVALDLDNGTLRFYKNDIDQGIAFSGISGDYRPAIRSGRDGTSSSASVNFGQKPFKFPPPAGFQPLNAANVKPETVIARPDQYVDIITYVGAGATKTFTGLNFGDVPDLVWMKNRDRTSYGDGTSAHNYLYDTVRGTGTSKMLTSSTNEAEGSKSTEADLDGFVKNGFRLDAASGTDCINNSGDDFVAWCWKAGGNKNTFNVDDVGYASAAAAGLTAGTLTISGASVGTKQGFSIIKYEGNGTSGATLPHGLTQAPDFVIVKNLEETESWCVYHSHGGGTKYGFLNVNNEFSASSALWNDTDPTSTVLTLGNYNGTNKDDIDFIAYLWHDIPGLQKFGTYEGSGNIDTGPFVELGFTPAVLMLKNYDDTEHWYVYDPKRSPHNVAYQSLKWSSKDAEETGSTNTRVDLLSNGFKLRQGNGPNNANTYIYAAWAEAPTFNLYGAQSNAR